MKISSFWVVTYPTKISTIDDICFRCTPQEFIRQAKGGLEEDNIVAVYEDEFSAKEKAEFLLHAVNAK